MGFKRALNTILNTKLGKENKVADSEPKVKFPSGMKSVISFKLIQKMDT
jgi:hypothetical protein